MFISFNNLIIYDVEDNSNKPLFYSLGVVRLMRLTWLGHAAFLIEDISRILIDPFITGNPMAPCKAEKTIYHAGVTCLFSDMKLIGELYKPEIALLPIGDRFTMNPEHAAKAASWINPKIVIPMHYNTFPPVEQNPEEFKRLVESLCDSEVVICEPGKTIEV